MVARRIPCCQKAWQRQAADVSRVGAVRNVGTRTTPCCLAAGSTGASTHKAAVPGHGTAARPGRDGPGGVVQWHRRHWFLFFLVSVDRVSCRIRAGKCALPWPMASDSPQCGRRDRDWFPGSLAVIRRWKHTSKILSSAARSVPLKLLSGFTQPRQDAQSGRPSPRFQAAIVSVLDAVTKMM